MWMNGIDGSSMTLPAAQPMVAGGLTPGDDTLAEASPERLRAAGRAPGRPGNVWTTRRGRGGEEPGDLHGGLL